MDIEFFKTLLHVVDGGSMAEAARRVGVTPAAVAQQMQAIERELGTAVFTRAGRTVIPTEAGHRVIERARNLVRDYGELKDFALQGEPVGELRIGTITTALLTVMPDVLAHFSKRFPQAKLLIRGGQTPELFETLKAGDIDVAVCLLPPFDLSKTFEWRLLREEPIVVLAPRALAGRDPDDLLRTEPFIRYDRTLGGGRNAEDYLRSRRIVPRELFELNSILTIAMMVDRGLGVALVPDIESPLLASLDIVKLTPPGPVAPRRFGLLWRRASPKSRLIQGLLETAQMTMRSLRGAGGADV